MTSTKIKPKMPFPISRENNPSGKQANAKESCSNFQNLMDNYLASKCSTKPNAMEELGDDKCPCSGNDPSKSGVDLVVLVDASGSMGAAWAAIGAAAIDATASAIASCNAKARVTYLFVDDRDGGSTIGPLNAVFSQSHEAYLRSIGYTGTFVTELDSPPKYNSEQGTEAIVDLCRHFDWQKGACRSILYVSDEVLSTSYQRNVAASLAATSNAIAAANAANVAVFTHFLGNGNVAFSDPNRASYASHYSMLATQTGGLAKIDPAPSTPTSATYVNLISTAICKGCGSPRCEELTLPKIEPCISIHWGDSECDCMEGDDHEALCITVSNCYSNITFSNLRIGYVIVVDENGNLAPNLPDGSPSSWIYPTGPICFGKIDPCVDGKPGSVSREAMIINRGLPPGKWFVQIGMVCFDVLLNYSVEQKLLSFDVCKN
jgi:hypothetical protein